MMFRAAVLSNSNPSIISHYLNSEIFDKRMLDLLNSLPYVKISNSRNKKETLNESTDSDEINKQKQSLRSVSSYELNNIEKKLKKRPQSIPNIIKLQRFDNRLTKSLTSI